MKFILAALTLSLAFAGELPTKWITGGPNCLEQPDWQVQEFEPDFFILRESGCTHYEKPFLYLIFGRDRALLEDTGAGTADTKAQVDKLIGKWLAARKRASIPLVVVHSHGHGDHTAGDKQFAGQPGVLLVPASVPDLQKAFGIANWPADAGQIDLGDRVIDVLGIPGHQDAAVALYDRKAGVLLTGDNLYPGRLYVRDWKQFAESTARLVQFTSTRKVTHILGTHIEQTNQPFVDYPVGTKYQPNEHTLELGRAHLLELHDALVSHPDKPERLFYRDFTIWPK
jgi:glyoxylase-like metal-dependent hydrolase (beta-lactamase superfamily II)